MSWLLPLNPLLNLEDAVRNNVVHDILSVSLYLCLAFFSFSFVGPILTFTCVVEVNV